MQNFILNRSSHLLLIGFLIGLASLAVPLLRDFHWESAALASLITSFYSCIQAANGMKTVQLLKRALGLAIGWAFPLLIFAIATNCYSTDGLGFWVMGPAPSILFGWATGRMIRQFSFKYPRAIAVSLIAGIASIPVVFQFFSFPQLYFFNHIWSYWPGPIYDEIVRFDIRLLAFRTITLLWVVTLWSLVGFNRHLVHRILVILGLSGLLFSYAHISNWGIIAPEEQIQTHLGGLHETDHFRIFYPAASVESDLAEEWGQRHETFLEQITTILEVDKQVYRNFKIESYIYETEAQKKYLTGAGQTSFAPVWLQQDQVHIAQDRLNRVLKHELVHIVAKQFGNRFGASSSIGLVEGLAVALDSGRYVSPIHNLVAARNDWPDSEELRELFHPVGFYTRPGPVSYLVSGSFIRYLLDHYPAETFKRAYRTGDIEYSYAPHSLNELAESWHEFLATLEIDKTDIERSETLFATRSIFQKRCPRVEKKQSIRSQIALKRSHTQLLQPPGQPMCQRHSE